MKILSCRRAALVAVSLAFVAACGPSVLKDQHGVKFTVGGQVVYAGPSAEPLGSVAITLVDGLGKSYAATTDSEGLWSIKDLLPGVYATSYTKEGYESLDTAIELDAFGQNNVSNPFFSAGQVQLPETLLRGTISPFSVTVKPGDSPRDGIGGNVLTYSIAADGAISVTFPRRVFGGEVRLTDTQTDQQIFAQQNSADGMTFTFSKNQIDNMNGGQNPLTPDTDPFTWHHLQLQNIQSYTPLHGDPQTLNAEAWFNATP